MEDKKVILSVKDLNVKFRVRGKHLTAIRGVSLDIYDGESIAIVGESGSGKSVFTKTFAGMLDSNGFIDKGSIIFNDEELADTVVKMDNSSRKTVEHIYNKLNEYSKYEFGAKTHMLTHELKEERRKKGGLSKEESEKYKKELNELKIRRTEAFNLSLTIDSRKDKPKLKEVEKSIQDFDKQMEALELEMKHKEQVAKKAVESDHAYINEYNEKMAKLEAQFNKEITQEISEDTKKRNEIIAKEVYLSVGRFSWNKRNKLKNELLDELKRAMKHGINLADEAARNRVFDMVTFRVKFIDETPERLHGVCVLNLAKIREEKDWTQIRGKKVSTVFQDPMTSLNPIITIGKQITSVIMKHQKVSEIEARGIALDLMKKVGIPHPEKRFDDYPFQYSGGMRQRMVIAIALSCQPKILICDEPTTALDVTIQAQILRLLKSLQKEFGYTIVFITHDLGVVANIADRVAVLYAGQIVEVASVEELFYDPRHPYTWALLSSMPQLAQKNTKLYSITGTPPSLYNQIIGDAFAPRNPYCMKIDTVEEPPMFKVSDTHYAKTWLLDPRAPKVEKPEAIQDIHEKLVKAFNI